MKTCKAPTLRLKALKKHSITHIMYIEMESIIRRKKKRKNPKKIRHAFLLWQREYTTLKLPPREHKPHQHHNEV